MKCFSNRKLYSYEKVEMNSNIALLKVCTHVSNGFVHYTIHNPILSLRLEISKNPSDKSTGTLLFNFGNVVYYRGVINAIIDVMYCVQENRRLK